jgi:hypothetical protein
MCGAVTSARKATDMCMFAEGRSKQELRCPFTLLLTGGEASSLGFDGQGSTILGTITITHTAFDMTTPMSGAPFT